MEENKFDVDSLKNFNFWSEKHNVFTEEINEIALSSNDDKRIQSILIYTYAYRMSKDLVSEKEEIECNKITK